MLYVTSNATSPLMLRKIFTYNPIPQSIEIEYVKWQDQEIPRTIYKYRSWDNKYHQKLINNRELYFPTPQELNDPFDCQRNFDFQELQDPNVYRKYIMIAAERIAKIQNYSEEEKDNFISQSLLQKMDVGKMEKQIEEEDNWINSLQGTFTASLISDSILLWSHYGDSHKGFCVGLDTEILLNGIKHSTIKEAQYCSKLALTSMLDDITAQITEKIFSKYEIWGYEYEYRILAGQLKNKKVFPSPEAFKEIIFGINMSEEKRRFIMFRAKHQMPNIKFYEAKKVKNEYRIEIQPILI